MARRPRLQKRSTVRRRARSKVLSKEASGLRFLGTIVKSITPEKLNALTTLLWCFGIIIIQLIEAILSSRKGSSSLVAGDWALMLIVLSANLQGYRGRRM